MAELDASAIVVAPNKEPFTLKPVVQDILRTRYCIPGSIFTVEGVDHAPLSTSGRWQAIRLLLSDGELCVQALLTTECHRFVHSNEVYTGCYVKVDTFQVHFEDGSIYLVVHDLETIGWNEAYRSMAQTLTQTQAMTATPVRQPAPVVSTEDLDDSDLEEAFEHFDPPPPQPQLSPSKQPVVTLAKDWKDYKTPLKLTTLHSIPNLPYSQNWSCNVLAIVTSLSEVESSYLPPYRQRTARIADPSTSKQVHLTVFLDPEQFNPAVGSAVLLTGVKNHRFDGGSLKKYASDKSKGQWWFENPSYMTWCDVAGILEWWSQVQAAAI